MGPARKSRSVNKCFSYITEISPTKDGENGKKSIQRKRKLSDILGPQWSKEELERFYEAYRKYGKDWKKVAAVVRNRSVEMVEALYTMNRAYLSLPEGTASVVGLIAMMTDHYCNLARSDSERDSNDGAGTSQKPQKRARGKVQPNISKGPDGRFPSHFQGDPSNYGCLSLLKKRRSGGNRPRAVGKRTPRFPISYDNVNREKYLSPSKIGLKSKISSADEVAHEIAIALAEASQIGGSPRISQTPNRRRECVRPSPVQNTRRTQAELQMTSTKPVGSDTDEDDLEGSMEADNGDFSSDKSYMMESENFVSLQKGRRLCGKKLEVDGSGVNFLDDSKEACSGTEEGDKFGAVIKKIDTEVTEEKNLGSSSQRATKRSKKVLFRRDEDPPFDALQTLADLSSMMPTTTNENEPSMQVKEDTGDLVDESGLIERMPENHQRDKCKSLEVKTKGNRSTSKLEAPKTKVSKPGKVSVLDVGAFSEAKQEPQRPTNKLSIKKKQKALVSRILGGETHSESLCESREAEAGDVRKKSTSKRSLQSAPPKLVKHLEHSSSNADPRTGGSDSALSTVQVPEVDQVNLPTKVRSRRKEALHVSKMLGDVKLSDKIITYKHNEKLHNCLSNCQIRRWCVFEWFYSAIDYPWFAKREFVEYLFHVGLGHVPRLSRVEWGVIRSSLGKPRRFSEQFLKEEKEKLNQYRDSVRTHYTELREGAREGLPTDLAKPLSVGQRVIAIHPRTREIHDGSVLTVDHHRCRVQFDRPELGVEFVMDIDCMPLNPSENMPTSLAIHTLAVEKLFQNLKEQKTNGQASLENIDGSFYVSPSTRLASKLLKQAKVASANASSQTKAGPNETTVNQQTANSQNGMLAHIQAKEADVQALAELTRALDKKEAVIFELRRMNDDVLENQKDGDSCLKDSESFKKQYAAVLLQLSEANEQVASALYCLRQRNTYQQNFPLKWPRSLANSGDSAGLLSSLDHSANHAQESGSHVNEIVESSRTKARMMIDAAMQAMSSLKGGQYTVENIEEAIDYVNDQLPLDDFPVAAPRSSTATDPVQGCLASQDQLNSSTLNSLQAPDHKLKGTLERNEEQIPSELITHCVATLFMIQKCTEREFPPADVAQILDSAVASLQPCCSQNLQVYTEIQKCMGIIRNQILALIPT